MEMQLALAQEKLSRGENAWHHGPGLELRMMMPTSEDWTDNTAAPSKEEMESLYEAPGSRSKL